MSITINGVALDYTDFQWPFYRDWNARTIVVKQGLQRYEEFDKSLKRKDNKLTIKDPSTGGKDFTVPCYADKVRKIDDKTMYITLQDNRAALREFLCPYDFNVIFDGHYVKDTAINDKDAASLNFALKKFRDLGVPPIKLEGNKGDEPLPDGMLLAGLKVADALQQIGNYLALDLVCDIEGNLHLVDRTSTSNLEGMQDYDWLQLPAFLDSQAVRRATPQTIIVPYKRRIEQEVRLEDGSRFTSSGSGDIEQYQLEQVYNYRGTYYSLGEMLARVSLHNLVNITITDAQIADNYMGLDWKGTDLDMTSLDAAKVETAKIVHQCIMRDWRVLFRLKLQDDRQGTWSNMSFGEIDTDQRASERNIDPAANVSRPSKGSWGVRPDRAVECRWTEMLMTPDIEDLAHLIGMKFTKSHQRGFAPFAPTWENYEQQIIRLQAPYIWERGGGGRIPGFTVEQAQLKIADAAKVSGDLVAVTGAITWDKMRFETPEEISIYMVGTAEAPNAKTRYHEESIPSEVKDAQGGTLYLEVANGLTADFIYDDPTKPENKSYLEADAKLRAEALVAEYRRQNEGIGTVLGLALAIDKKFPTGMLTEYQVHWGSSHGRATISIEVTLGQHDIQDARLELSNRRKAEHMSRELLGKKVRT